MGRPGYLAEFRRKVLDLLAGGRSVASIAYDLGISDQTIYAWRRQTASTAAKFLVLQLGRGPCWRQRRNA